MKILGIESSCDETAVAIVEDGYKILSSVVASQIAEHKPFGGVVPEVAAREHHKNLAHVLDEALGKKFKLDDIDAFAVTQKPGLIGALLIGVSAAKTLAWRMNKPLIAIDHIDGHIYSAYLQAKIELSEIDVPMIALVVSGGHTAMFYVKNVLENELIGKTRDDAAGEAFDKVAAMLRLEYPGGPSIQESSKHGNPKSVRFPRSMIHDADYNFSFSGIKTAVLYYLRGQDAKGKRNNPEIASVPDIAASFQQAVVDVLTAKLIKAAKDKGVKVAAITGGVAANKLLREQAQAMARNAGIRLVVPALDLCTDNAAFIAGLAYHKFQAGLISDLQLDAKPYTYIRQNKRQ